MGSRVNKQNCKKWKGLQIKQGLVPSERASDRESLVRNSCCFLLFFRVAGHEMADYFNREWENDCRVMLGRD